LGITARTLRHLARFSFKVDRWGTIANLVLMISVTVTIATLALAQRWVVDGAHQQHTGWLWLLPPLVLAAVAQAMCGIGGRLQNNLRADLASKLEVELDEEVYSYVARMPGIEHLERADYLDRVFVAVKGTGTLAAYARGALDTVSTILSLPLSGILARLGPPAAAALGGDDPAAVEAAVGRGGADQTVAKLADGLDTQLGRVFGGAELSHSQWQQLALARGQMRTAPLLLVLDELAPRRSWWSTSIARWRTWTRSWRSASVTASP
jgi:ABC-type multidrug transport system fused ATPase/permease subunit